MLHRGSIRFLQDPAAGLYPTTQSIMYTPETNPNIVLMPPDLLSRELQGKRRQILDENRNAHVRVLDSDNFPLNADSDLSSTLICYTIHHTNFAADGQNANAQTLNSAILRRSTLFKSLHDIEIPDGFGPLRKHVEGGTVADEAVFVPDIRKLMQRPGSAIYTPGVTVFMDANDELLQRPHVINTYCAAGYDLPLEEKTMQDEQGHPTQLFKDRMKEKIHSQFNIAIYYGYRKLILDGFINNNNKHNPEVVEIIADLYAYFLGKKELSHFFDDVSFTIASPTPNLQNSNAAIFARVIPPAPQPQNAAAFGENKNEDDGMIRNVAPRPPSYLGQVGKFSQPRPLAPASLQSLYGRDVVTNLGKSINAALGMTGWIFIYDIPNARDEFIYQMSFDGKEKAARFAEQIQFLLGITSQSGGTKVPFQKDGSWRLPFTKEHLHQIYDLYYKLGMSINIELRMLGHPRQGAIFLHYDPNGQDGFNYQMSFGDDDIKARLFANEIYGKLKIASKIKEPKVPFQNDDSWRLSFTKEHVEQILKHYLASPQAQVRNRP